MGAGRPDQPRCRPDDRGHRDLSNHHHLRHGRRRLRGLSGSRRPRLAAAHRGGRSGPAPGMARADLPLRLVQGAPSIPCGALGTVVMRRLRIPEVWLQEDGVFLHVVDAMDVGRPTWSSRIHLPAYCPPPSPRRRRTQRRVASESQWLNGTGTYLQGFRRNPGARIPPRNRDRWGQCIWPRKTRAPTGPEASEGQVRRTGQAASERANTSSCPASTHGMHYPTSKGRERRTSKVTLVR